MKQAMKFLRRMARGPRRTYGREDVGRYRHLLALVERGKLIPVPQSHREIAEQGLVLRDGQRKLSISPSGFVECYAPAAQQGLYAWVHGVLCYPAPDREDGGVEVYYTVGGGIIVVPHHEPPTVE